jgi:hypothetical protein
MVEAALEIAVVDHVGRPSHSSFHRCATNHFGPCSMFNDALQLYKAPGIVTVTASNADAVRDWPALPLSTRRLPSPDVPPISKWPRKLQNWD